VYHNYIKPHEGLNGKTPAEACGIVVEWMNVDPERGDGKTDFSLSKLTKKWVER
jgi:hypothetical protein